MPFSVSDPQTLFMQECLVSSFLNLGTDRSTILPSQRVEITGNKSFI